MEVPCSSLTPMSYLKETPSFGNNSASYGAALHVCGESRLYLRKGIHILFDRNLANLAGGAIYMEGGCLQTIPRCFFQLMTNSTLDQLITNNEISLNFTSNRALIAGDAIYGGSVDHCFLEHTFSSKLSHYIHGKVYRAISHISPQSPSIVMSDPNGVCLCDLRTNYINCSIRELKLKKRIFPGENFFCKRDCYWTS